MPTINDALVNAFLADATYALGQGVPDGITGGTLKSLLQDRMTLTLAEYVAGNFTMVTHIETDDVSGSGFDATVWRRNSDDKVFVSMQGTEGFADFLVDGDLTLSGGARAQLADMVNWWLRIATGVNEAAPQIRSLVFPTVDVNGQLQYFEFAAPVAGAGLLVGATNLELNGHSLGGHLATAFARIFGGSTAISHISTFNSAGFTASSEAIFQNLQSLLGMGTSAFPDAAQQSNYFAKNGLNVTTNTFWFNQIGERVEVFNEEGTGFPNHYMYRLTDALALADAMSKLDAGLSISSFNAIVGAAANDFIPGGGSDLTPQIQRSLSDSDARRVCMGTCL